MKFLKKKNRGNIFSEEAGQASAVFRLMVDAIIGFAILMIIVSALTYFNDLRIRTSLSEFNSLVESAVNSPDGKIVESNSLVFSKGQGFSSQSMQAITGVPASCFLFKTNLSFVDVGNGLYIEIRQNTETKVYAQCLEASLGSCDNSTCEICCIISFGKKIA